MAQFKIYDANKKVLVSHVQLDANDIHKAIMSGDPGQLTTHVLTTLGYSGTEEYYQVHEDHDGDINQFF